MRISVTESLADVPARQWNSLVKDRDPFLSHEFLSALERHHCVGERTGWLPYHLLCRGDDGRLLGACPLYLKTNSYGEFVFDWSWAEAYRRNGLRYYPKLVSAIPFTPATGQRLLLAPEAPPAVAAALIGHALEETRRLGCSSLHWLFPQPEQMPALLEQGLLQRLGCQFHWHNPGYRDFADFLDTLSSKKRKNIRRERRLVEQAGVELEVLQGREIRHQDWQVFHGFYRSTFARLGGYATLTLPFFQEIGQTLGNRVILVLARVRGHSVAGALCLRSDHTLYGRHWGANESYDSLHFEACYYQGIEFCIRHGLRRFEPGAQGEHKVSRGFLPTFTYSAHWLAHPAFHSAVATFLERETPAVRAYADELAQHSPYRSAQETVP
ncbi:MAG TPA: GNAT family N-acetyltransferase [Candidatus Competibacteraceae bacterium]|nr:GNAT family N-acetyltransferase [Candidatus Competibacteraceae bacterium]